MPFHNPLTYFSYNLVRHDLFQKIIKTLKKRVICIVQKIENTPT